MYQLMQIGRLFSRGLSPAGLYAAKHLILYQVVRPLLGLKWS
jgi:hypothetical protein